MSVTVALLGLAVGMSLGRGLQWLRGWFERYYAKQREQHALDEYWSER